MSSLNPIDGFTYKEAGSAFRTYENLKSQISVDARKKTTTINTGMAGFNYVEFVMELNEEPQAVVDGQTVLASVLDLEEELLVHNRRMVFVNNSAPEIKLRGLTKGAKLHVIGIPRIDLALVSWRTQNFKKLKQPEILQWNLPYEIVVVAVVK